MTNHKDDEQPPLEYPYVFSDGRVGKVWISYGPPTYELDGPFDSREDAQATLDRINVKVSP